MPSWSEIPVAGALALLLVGCGAPAPRPVAPPPAPLTVDAVVGYWSGDWGRLVLRSRGGLILGSYDRDDGTITAKLDGETLAGWWCAAPSRLPDADAGRLELRDAGTGPTRTLTGRWHHGAATASDDMTLTFDPGEPPAELTARFDDPGLFCTE